jgi:thioredoxin 1
MIFAIKTKVGFFILFRQNHYIFVYRILIMKHIIIPFILCLHIISCKTKNNTPVETSVAKIDTPVSPAVITNDTDAVFVRGGKAKPKKDSTELEAHTKAEVKHFTADNFVAEVMNSSGITVVDCWATWCGPCKVVEPIMTDLSNEYNGKVVVGKLDVDESQQIVEQLSISSIPAVFVFKNGQIVEKIVGARPKAVYVNAIEKAMK